LGTILFCFCMRRNHPSRMTQYAMSACHPKFTKSNSSKNLQNEASITHLQA
jgi:hypothetical protein